jgi:hypothetical protein
MFHSVENTHDEEKPASGWACVGLAVGFIALLGGCLAAVLLIG